MSALVRTSHWDPRKVHRLKEDGGTLCGTRAPGGVWQEEMIGECTCAKCNGTGKPGRKVRVIVRHYSGYALRFRQVGEVRVVYEIVSDEEATVFEHPDLAKEMIEALGIDYEMVTIEAVSPKKNTTEERAQR